jgi:hypothetical protein
MAGATAGGNWDLDGSFRFKTDFFLKKLEEKGGV